MIKADFLKLGYGFRAVLSVPIQTDKGVINAGEIVAVQWGGYEQARVYHHATKQNFNVTRDMIDVPAK